jgi:hypothetical protein
MDSRRAIALSVDLKADEKRVYAGAVGEELCGEGEGGCRGGCGSSVSEFRMEERKVAGAWDLVEKFLVFGEDEEGREEMVGLAAIFCLGRVSLNIVSYRVCLSTLRNYEDERSHPSSQPVISEISLSPIAT